MSRIEKGLAAARAGDLQRAKADFEQALRVDPNHFDALQLLGNLHLVFGEPTKALRLLQSASIIDPYFPPLLLNIGKCYAQLSDCRRALEFYDKALAARPGYEDALFCKGVELNRARNGMQALACFEPLVRRHPSRVDLLCEYVLALCDVGDYTSALEITDKILLIDPNFAEGRDTRGTILAEMGRNEEAAREYERATALKPDNTLFRIHQAYNQILMYNFKDGWLGFESRFDAHAGTTYGQHPLAPYMQTAKRWSQPEDFHAKTVLVVAEQGPGDNIMFASILPDLMSRASSVQMCVGSRLKALFNRSFPEIELQAWSLLENKAFLAKFDRVVCVGSLAHAFRNSVEDFNRERFLILDPVKVGTWRSRLEGSGKKLIGLSWKGGTALTRSKHRSLALRDFEPLVSRTDCLFVNLQHGDVSSEIAEFRQSTGQEIVSFPATELHDIDDLASLTGALDAVLTVQNTNVHVAGALGKPCFAILPAVPEWRYGASGDSMVWYKSVELFRRAAGAGIETVLAPLTARLSSLEIGPR